jgi:hypothetical protein
MEGVGAFRLSAMSSPAALTQELCRSIGFRPFTIGGLPNPCFNSVATGSNVAYDERRLTLCCARRDAATSRCSEDGLSAPA